MRKLKLRSVINLSKASSSGVRLSVLCFWTVRKHCHATVTDLWTPQLQNTLSSLSGLCSFFLSTGTGNGFSFNFLLCIGVADYQCCDRFRWIAKGFTHIYTCIHSPPKLPLVHIPDEQIETDRERVSPSSQTPSLELHKVGTPWISSEILKGRW